MSNLWPTGARIGLPVSASGNIRWYHDAIVILLWLPLRILMHILDWCGCFEQPENERGSPRQ